MRILLFVALASSVSLASFCNKSDDSKKSDDKSASDKDKDKSKKKKSGDDDDDDDDKGGAPCKATFAEAAKNKDNEFKFKCPADCNTSFSIWGTGWYTTDSIICIAAVHSGAIKASKGGEVTVTAHKGLKSYKGSKANGVESIDYGAFDNSFSINGSDDGNDTPKKGEAEKVDCNASVNSLGHKDDESFKVVCPPGCKQGGSVWGTDTYTSDSAICRAAVLEGVVTDDDGGKVTVKVKPGQKSYTGSKKNGVKSEDYGEFDTSFTIE